MKFHLYGKEENPVIVLIHGMGMNAQYFSPLVDALKNRYCIVTVDLDGHDSQNTQFTTIQNQAEKITVYINENFDNKLKALIGMSVGGFMAMDMICRCGLRVDKLILDSGYVHPLPCKKIFSIIVAWGFERIIQGKGTLISQIGCRLLMGYPYTQKELCLTVKREDIYRVEYSCMTYTLPTNLELLNEMNTYFLYGNKEKVIIAGMKLIYNRVPNMRKINMGNVGHGELRYKNPNQYIQLICECLQ